MGVGGSRAGCGRNMGAQDILHEREAKQFAAAGNAPRSASTPFPVDLNLSKSAEFIKCAFETRPHTGPLVGMEAKDLFREREQPSSGI